MTGLAEQYGEALERLAALGPELRFNPDGTPRKFSLDLIRTLLRGLGNPERKFASVLVAGTNGKGSTSATLASIAAAGGLRTGLYTSPHLLRVNERIRVAGATVSTGNDAPMLADISDEDFGHAFEQVDHTARQLVSRGELPHGPSYFEMLTAMAFVHFAGHGVELAVLEVGLGGRLDATNVVEPLVSVITDIGMDHMEFLGHTLAEIAGEKAGILRQEGVLVTLSQHPEANAAIGERAVALGVRGVDAARFLPPRGFAGRPHAAAGTALEPVSVARRKSTAAGPVPWASGSPLGRNAYDLALDGEVLHLDSPLSGHHQQRNIALAVAAAVELRSNHSFRSLTNEAVERGVRETAWPGRLEWLPGRLRPDGARHAPLLLDVAHNPAGTWTLRAALAQLPEDRPRTLIFSALADKQIEEMARILFPLFDSASSDPLRAGDHIVLAPIQNPRAASLSKLQAAAQALEVPVHAAPHVPGALLQAEAVTPPDGLIVATGSVFLVGEVRALVLAEPA